MKRFFLFLLPVLAIAMTSCDLDVASTPTIQLSNKQIRTSITGVKDTISINDSVCIGDTVRMGVAVHGVYHHLDSVWVKADTSKVSVALLWNEEQMNLLTAGADPQHGSLIFASDTIFGIATVLVYIPKEAGKHEISINARSAAKKEYSGYAAPHTINVKANKVTAQ